MQPRELISTDVYQPMNAVVLRGTKKVEAPKPEEKPEDKPAENTENQTPEQ